MGVAGEMQVRLDTRCITGLVWSRLAHYVVYTLGIPVPRTLAFVGGFVAQVILVLAFFKLI
jgi:uncharacterized MAPEG superfamily protein